MHDAKPALHVRFGWKSFATFAGDLEKTGCPDRMIDLPYGLRVVGCGWKTTAHLRRRKFGQEAGVCTRTVSFTGRDAADYTTILILNLEPLVGLAPTNSGLRNRSCGC
jgi:hypothetical protein